MLPPPVFWLRGWPYATRRIAGLLFRPEHYLEAASDRLNEALLLHGRANFAAAIYFAGVGVECLLRAYRVRDNTVFDARHDLAELLRQSRLLSFVEPSDSRITAAALGEVWSHWKNDYRYASNARLLSEFKQLKLHRDTRGDQLKAASSAVIDAAFTLLTKGRQRWTISQAD